MSDNVHELIRVSNALGSRVAYVQGGGGNTSLKTSKTEMHIKVSGAFLADISDHTGFLPVNWPMLCAGLDSCETEADYSQLLAASTLVDEGASRPSIETGFHALLDCCTLHSHSVWANLLACSMNGEELVNGLLPSAVWVPYFTPGLALTKAISERLSGRKNVTIFLQNHGVVVSGPDAATAMAMHEAVTDAVRGAYPNLIDFDEAKDDPGSIVIDGLLFPDQAIYHANAMLAASRAGRETMRACTFLIDRIERAGLKLRYIDKPERENLLNMESEKFRQMLIAK